LRIHRRGVGSSHERITLMTKDTTQWKEQKVIWLIEYEQQQRDAEIAAEKAAFLQEIAQLVKDKTPEQRDDAVRQLKQAIAADANIDLEKF